MPAIDKWMEDKLKTDRGKTAVETIKTGKAIGYISAIHSCNIRLAKRGYIK